MPSRVGLCGAAQWRLSTFRIRMSSSRLSSLDKMNQAKSTSDSADTLTDDKPPIGHVTGVVTTLWQAFLTLPLETRIIKEFSLE